ncbi:hypothetical protein FRB99_007152 [Tulasnella sp. 403]|nr:hypothetical protein FRB99_007152 [Tulasnella sp. 403]
MFSRPALTYIERTTASPSIMSSLLKRPLRSSNQHLPLHAIHGDDDDTDMGRYTPTRRRISPRTMMKIARMRMVWCSAVAILCLVFLHKYMNVPGYKDIRKYERELEQHSLDLPFPEGKDGRFVKFDVSSRKTDWSTALQEIIMLSHIAYASGRGKVFDDYVWSAGERVPVVMDKDFNLRSTRMPFNALLGGPIAGGSWARDTPMANGAVSNDTSESGQGDDSTGHSNSTHIPDQYRPPRFISEEWWKRVCAPARRKLVDGSAIKTQLGSDPEGSAVLNKWVEVLGGLNDTCVEVSGEDTFTFRDLGAPRWLSAWDALRGSPVLQQFQWSPLVQHIVTKNLDFLDPSFDQNGYFNDGDDGVPSKLPGLLAIHVRRGDFENRCQNLAMSSALPYAMGSSPDYVSSEAGDFEEHCFPTVDQIIRRVRKVQREWEVAHPESELKRIYVMTDTKTSFHKALKAKLECNGWDVASTNALKVPRDAVEVIVGADMMIAERAEVFIGNGVCRSPFPHGVRRLEYRFASIPASFSTFQHQKDNSD